MTIKLMNLAFPVVACAGTTGIFYLNKISKPAPTKLNAKDRQLS